MTENTEKSIVDIIKDDAKDTFWSDYCKDLRNQIKSIEFSMDYFTYQMHCLSEKRMELMKEYQEQLGLGGKDDTTKAQA